MIQSKLNNPLTLLEENTVIAKNALINGDIDVLGETLDVAQRELTLLGVSDSGINLLVSAAKQKGALGAKLTGGGRGGCILALAKDHQHVNRT